MEYQVPQFIDVESKIIGPLTLRQFIYVAGAGGLCVVFFVYLNLVIALLLSALVIAFAVALAFYKINNKPFIAMLEAGFNYYTGAKFFLWKHEDTSKGERSAAAVAAAAAEASRNLPQGTPKLTRGKLSELAWSLDVKNPSSGEQNPT